VVSTFFKQIGRLLLMLFESVFVLRQCAWTSAG